MVSTLFSACQFREQCCTWQEAVQLACLPLEEQGAITNRYTQAIIRETEQHGPWYILSPEFALPHARPEEGVIGSKTHLSLLCLKQAVQFPGHPDVRLIIVLAAADSTQHIEMIQQLVCWLDEAERLHQLSHATCLAQLHSALEES
ncbi:MAG: PTS sugar transporter subunit IIA [Citrobacter sp.]|uniref:Ascorbate-specific PTS system EIIA component n=1 Tax=Citrobacter tructae TaxID=2562449 RepID=A0ABX5T4V5_9ENTR|nr:PTS sugar transporter subunit IIA [Citrobacter tructae]QBX80543.1 PTS sugar transporter subunit IIA [Citrobacter tructae]